MAGGRFSIDAVFRAVDRMTAPIRKMEAAVSRFSKSTSASLKEVNRVTGDIHGGLARIAGVAATAGAAVGVVGYNVLKVGSDFDQAMANLGAVSLKTRDEIADLEKKARQLGDTTKFTATQAAEGMELMAKAGFENAQIMQSIDGVLNAAAAEGAELAETASHVSNVLKGMGLEASEAGRVADVLALASARTNSSMSSLGESMANVSSTARQFKIPLEQIVGSVALLQDVGLDASVAGSAMNTMLTQLAAPTDKAKESMRKLGVHFADAKGNMLPLTEVMGQLMKAMDKSKGNMGAVAFFAELVGLRGQKAAQNLADLFKTIDPTTGKSKVVTLFEELSHATDGVGAASEMASIRMDTFQGDMLKLEAAVDGVKIELFDLNRGPLREVVQGMAKWVEQNKALILSRTQEYIEKFVDRLPEIVTWTTRIGKGLVVFYSFAAAVKVAKVAVDAYLLTTKGFAAVTGGIKAMTVAMGLYNAEVAAATGGLTGMRAGLNAGALSQAINGVTSKLGKFGLLGAALAVGVAFGTWLNNTFELDKKIADLVGRITGLNDQLADRSGLGKHIQVFADGTEIDTKTHQIIKKGTNWQDHAQRLLKKTIEEGNITASPLENVVLSDSRGDPLSRFTGNPWATPELADAPDYVQAGDADWRTQMITPQERTARTIEETNATTTNEAEVTIRDETGRAQVTKKPKAMKLKLQPTGG